MTRQNVVIIGASSGIGRELARVFSDNHYVVGVTARRLELLSEMKKELPGILAVQRMDVASPDEAINIFEALIKEMGGIDIVVINAGIGFINPDLIWEKEKSTIDVNVIGFTAMANVAMRHFLSKGSGQLVSISSIAAIRGCGEAPAYNASKAYISNYMEGLRKKVAKLGLPIVVTDIQPGFVDTAMAKGEGLFWVAPVEKAALQIFNAIRNKKVHAYITKRWRIISCLLKIMPNWLYHRL